MTTPELEAAYENIKAMDVDIQKAEANLRVLKAINSPTAMQLESQLNERKRQRREFMTAIENERNVP